MRSINANEARKWSYEKRFRDAEDLLIKIHHAIKRAAESGSFDTVVHGDFYPEKESFRDVIGQLERYGFVIEVRSESHRNERHTEIKISWEEVQS